MNDMLEEILWRDKIFYFLSNSSEEVQFKDLLVLIDKPEGFPEEDLMEGLKRDPRLVKRGEAFCCRPLEFFHEDVDLRQAEFVITDIETTGPLPLKNSLIEIAATRVKGGEIIDEFESFVATHERIPPYIRKITGISEEDLQDAPCLDRVLQDYREFVQNSIFCAHNASFDFFFLKGIYGIKNSDFLSDKIPFCTLKLAQTLLPEVRACGISSLAGIFDLEIKNRHRAMSDVYATKQIFDILLEKLDREPAKISLHQLFKLQMENRGLEEISRLLKKRKKKNLRRSFKKRTK